ncbi:hypothetical protein PGH07_06465 [Sulfurovum sp. zt1-1]|uniref:Uncharacterized protein n=1 Tax=Sulfurovum zhangzhouensis TaxID=3019067 RepID=A0ABT7QY94_9BACT|nr:hypothetical protein [Sulfurovum zhangzhouensis]MDM5271814.1 hypothetical protein [Sulfurovum zhangzhouensis]
MRGDTQANRLEMMMKKHQVFPHYILSLPPFEMKKSALKELKKGDILLLGLDHLSLVLSDTKGICAEVMIEHHNYADRLKIISLHNHTKEKPSKKHQVVTVSFGEIQSRKLEVGHVIGTMDLNFEDLNIVTEQKEIAQCSLINVDGEIAVQVNSVNQRL